MNNHLAPAQVLAGGVSHRSCVPKVGRIALGCLDHAASRSAVCYCRGDNCNRAAVVATEIGMIGLLLFPVLLTHVIGFRF